MTDAAGYRCLVTNSYGSATSNSATLTVGPPSSVFIVESRSGGKNFANYSETGTWGDSNSYKSSAPGCTAGIGHRWCTIGATPVSAAFTYTPPLRGTYEIFTTNCTTENSGNPLIHKVMHSGGTASVGVCQNTTCSPNAVNVWYSLGQYVLNAGTQYSVTLDGSFAAGSGPTAPIGAWAGRSDAIKWSLVSAASIAADLDGDGDVDQADFGIFAPCLSGPNVNLNPGCESSDFDGDNDVDQSDFGIFQRCYSGENVPGNPNCAN